jgi:hypothetical protein
MVEVTARSRAPQPRNWYAIACLWLVVASWLALALRILVLDVFSIDSALDWLYLIVLLSAPIVGAAGLIAVRRRGDALLAVTVFACSLLLPAIYVFVHVLVDVLFGGLGGGGLD